MQQIQSIAVIVGNSVIELRSRQDFPESYLALQVQATTTMSLPSLLDELMFVYYCYCD